MTTSMYVMHNTEFVVVSRKARKHYGDVIMGTIASQITSLTIVYSTIYSDADQRKHQSSASLAFVRGIHRGPVNSLNKRPVTRKMFPYDDVIMNYLKLRHWSITGGEPTVRRMKLQIIKTYDQQHVITNMPNFAICIKPNSSLTLRLIAAGLRIYASVIYSGHYLDQYLINVYRGQWEDISLQF